MIDTDEYWEIQCMYLKRESKEWLPVAYDHHTYNEYHRKHPDAKIRRVGIEGQVPRVLLTLDHAVECAKLFRSHASPSYLWRMMAEDNKMSIPMEALE